MHPTNLQPLICGSNALVSLLPDMLCRRPYNMISLFLVFVTPLDAGLMLTSLLWECVGHLTELRVKRERFLWTTNKFKKIHFTFACIFVGFQFLWCFFLGNDQAQEWSKTRNSIIFIGTPPHPPGYRLPIEFTMDFLTFNFSIWVHSMCFNRYEFGESVWYLLVLFRLVLKTETNVFE